MVSQQRSIHTVSFLLSESRGTGNSTWISAAARLRAAVFLAVVAALIPLAAPADAVDSRPNIVWIIVDDMSPNFGCYGEAGVATPHVDRLAREGVRFANAFVTAPVCSPSRSALVTGMYQTTINAHHHRSGRGELKIRLPPGVEPIPSLFKRAGYYTCIGSGDPGCRGLGKTDYNFEWDESIYDGCDWSGRRPGQPFFMQVQLLGGKHRDGGHRTDLVKRIGAARAKPQAFAGMPPYYPPDPAILEDWALYLDAVSVTDAEVGAVIARLEREGLLEGTLVAFMTDHGISHARGKQFLYDEGTRVPLVIRGPRLPRGLVREDLVEHIDLAALSLAAAGIPLPDSMQAKDILAADGRPRDAVFAARDRCDETVDRIRSVRTDRFLYIRNFLPDRPALQPNAYKDAKPTLRRLRQLHAEGALPELTERLLFATTRPPEELYEWTTDRWQITNLAEDPARRDALEAHRAMLDRWMADTHDPGPEPAAMYDSDMRAILGKGNNAPTPVPAVTGTMAPCTFAVVGDFGLDIWKPKSNPDDGTKPRERRNPFQAAVADLVAGWRPDFVVTTGDNNYPKGEAATIDANIGKYYASFIGNYRGIHGSGSPANRFFPVLGNHDWDAPGQGCKPYLEYFTLPGNERYYDFVWGPVHFFMLDNDGREPDGATPGSKQHEWFTRAIAASATPFQVVVAHHPPHSSGEHGPIRGADWAFHEHGVEMMLAGHDHGYERIERDGVVYVVNGAGGANLRRFKEPAEGSVVRYKDKHGAQKLAVRPAAAGGGWELTAAFVAVDGTEIDSFTITRP